MRLNRLWPVLAGMLLLLGAGSAHAQSSDGSVTLQWTAPGDDSLTGTATRYDLRFSLFPINELNFPYCTGSTGLPRPAAPGTLQRFTVYGLLPGLRYYFALKTADERLNWSKISNVVAFAQPSVGVDPNLNLTQFAAPFPNPTRVSAGFAYSLARSAHFRAEVMDVQGRLVARLANADFPAGPGLLNWDLKDFSGRTVQAGVYLVHARIGESEFMHRVLVVR